MKGIRSGDCFTHVKTGKIYKVLSVGKMKLPDGTWVDAISYVEWGRFDLYTRSLESFSQKFVECPQKPRTNVII